MDDGLKGTDIKRIEKLSTKAQKILFVDTFYMQNVYTKHKILPFVDTFGLRNAYSILLRFVHIQQNHLK